MTRNNPSIIWIFLFEGLELARERDRRAMEAWGEHPYIDVVDNRADFETKVWIQWVRPNWVRVKAVSKLQNQLKYLGLFLSSILLHKVIGLLIEMQKKNTYLIAIVHRCKK